MDASRIPIRPRPAGLFSFLSRSPSFSHMLHGRILWISTSSVAAAFVLLYLSASSRSSDSSRFGIVIDAGSSGTRIHVFASNGETGIIPSLDLDSTAVMRVTPGLSSFSADPEHAGESLVELLEFARDKVAKDLQRVTEVRLMATAGLRMVEAGARERILESCRKVLRSSGFRFKDDWATVIPGSDEGTYAWIAANYALGTLGSDPANTTGIVELGGASAQVTFVSSEELPPELSHELTFGKTTYKLYTNSFLHFGQNVAHETVREILNQRNLNSWTLDGNDEFEPVGTLDPCSPTEYSHGGNFSKCRYVAFTMLQKEKDNCLYQQCHSGSTFIPKMQGNFIATENFFFTSKFFGPNPKSSLSDLMLAGEEFCEEDWSKTKQKYHSTNKEDGSRYCFSAAYIVALLHDIFGIPLEDKRIEYSNQVGDIQIEWALGAYIAHSTKSSSDWTAAGIHKDFFLFILSCSLLVFAAWLMVSKWRRRRTKTIYDLEKGGYIVTHIG